MRGALTQAAWEDCVAWDNEQEGAHQDETGRLWDVLYMTVMAIKGANAFGRDITITCTAETDSNALSKPILAY